MLRKSRPCILVVDDLADAADSCVMLLELWGYSARACYSGAAALEAARSCRPQVVLLDVGMPRMDGFQVAQRLRDQPRFADTVIVGITGFGGDTYRHRGLVAGFDQYLLKPVAPDYLQELMGRIAPIRLLFEMSEPVPQQQVTTSFVLA